jgi:hypothetical protein
MKVWDGRVFTFLMLLPEKVHGNNNEKLGKSKWTMDIPKCQKLLHKKINGNNGYLSFRNLLLFCCRKRETSAKKLMTIF